MKTHWQVELETTITQLTSEVDSRLEVCAHDPVAHGMRYALREFSKRIEDLTAPGRFLSPAEYGAALPRRVDEQTVRRWIQRGELDATDGPRGYLIPAGAVRRQLRKVG